MTDSNPPNVIPVISPQADLPPLPPDFQSTGSSDQSAVKPPAPTDTPPVITPGPKKKFSRGRIIATILGFLVLVGGIIGGVILTQQQQDIRERASCDDLGSPAARQACWAGESGGGDDGCSSNADCGIGTVCSGGDCVASGGGSGSDGDGGGCQSNADCGIGTVCSGGDCVASGGGSGSGCTNNSECGSGTICQGGQCITLTVTCGDGVCSQGENNTSCASDCPIGIGTQCASSGECGSGQQCVNGNCVSTSCLTTNDCPGGQSCQSGLCVAGGGGTCQQEVKCDANGCTVGSKFDGSTGQCAVYKYKCPNDWPSGVSCDESTGGVFVGAGASASFSGCGTEQIDIDCAICNASVSTGYWKSKFNQGSCTTGGNGTPPPTSGAAQCQDIKAKSKTDWSVLSATQLSQLKADDQVYFCVRGSATDGDMDKARFTINGTLQSETILRPPAPAIPVAYDEFCQLYTIPSGTTSFNITAQIHHPTLGWK